MAETWTPELTTEPGWIALDDGWRVRRDIWKMDDPDQYSADRWVALPPGQRDDAICFESYMSADEAAASVGMTIRGAA